MTTSWSRGISRSMFLRLCSRAPLTTIRSLAMSRAYCVSLARSGQDHSRRPRRRTVAPAKPALEQRSLPHASTHPRRASPVGRTRLARRPRRSAPRGVRGTRPRQRPMPGAGRRRRPGRRTPRRRPASPRGPRGRPGPRAAGWRPRSEEHTSELQSQSNLVCRLLLEKKKYFLSFTVTFLSIKGSNFHVFLHYPYLIDVHHSSVNFTIHVLSYNFNFCC